MVRLLNGFYAWHLIIMTQFQKISLFLLRITMGWMIFYSGITKVIDPTWSAAGYLRGSKMFTEFYWWLSTPGVLPVINLVNEWSLTLLGLSLLFGICVRLSSFLGVALMLLYYFPILDFPYPNPHAYIVDEHIIYISALLLFASFRAGRIWGLENLCSNLPLCSQFPRLRNLLG